MVDLDEKTKNYITSAFSKMQDPVRIVFFYGPNCQYCDAIRDILITVKGLAPEGKIVFEEHDFEKEGETAKALKVDKYPATVLKAGKKLLHFYGVMSGYEFGTLIEDLVDLSTGDTNLSEKTIKTAERIKDDLRLMVFVTPTCPYCPRMVRLAHQLAMVNPRITSEMIEAMEFPDLSREYMVSGVPRTIVKVDGKDVDAIEGAVPEEFLMQRLARFANMEP